MKPKTDKQLIQELGGVSALAKSLGYSQQRVFNWQTRGIPPAEKVKRPDLFMPSVFNRSTSHE